MNKISVVKIKKKNQNITIDKAFSADEVIEIEKNEADEAEKKCVLIIAFTNDNHLSNVKMIQSIFKQDYENIILAICNDSTGNFQEERFFYNLAPNRPDGVRKIYFNCNKYTIGEINSFKNLVNKFKSEYVFVIHSGEYFTENSSIKKCVEIFEENENSVAISARTEVWSDDMKKCNETLSYSVDNFLFDKIIGSSTKKTSDCMFMYRTSLLDNIEISNKYKNIYLNIISEIEKNKYDITASEYSICKFSPQSISNA